MWIWAKRALWIAWSSTLDTLWEGGHQFAMCWKGSHQFGMLGLRTHLSLEPLSTLWGDTLKDMYCESEDFGKQRFEDLRSQGPQRACGRSRKSWVMSGPLRGSGYLGYVDSNQGYNPYKWVICPQILGL